MLQVFELEELQKESERQCKKNDGLREVLLEYERTISEQIQDKERQSNRYEIEIEGLRQASAQANDDLSQVRPLSACCHKVVTTVFRAILLCL